jgi:HK97 family phage major capsid protein
MATVEDLQLELKNLVKDRVSIDTFTTKFDEYKAQIEKRNKEIADEIKAEHEIGIEAVKNEFNEKLATAATEMAKSFVNRSDDQLEKPNEEKYGKDFGSFLWKAKTRSLELKQLVENVGADGGYLVPEYWSRDILQIALESNIVRGLNPSIINMPSNRFSVPNIVSTSQSGSTYGGIITYWGNEGLDMSNYSTKPKFGKITLEAQKLFGYTESSEELTEDAITAVGPLLMGVFGRSLGFEEDYQFINGNGVNKPLGVVSAPCMVTASRGTASTINTDDVVEMLSRFSGNLDNAVWMTNQSTIPQLFTLQDAAGNYIWFPGASGNIAARSPGSLYGIPLIITEKCQALGTTGDLVLADWTQYLIGDRGGLRIEESRDYRFPEDVRCWKLVKRVDGKPWLATAITPKKGGSTLSPFVCLS